MHLPSSKSLLLVATGIGGLFLFVLNSKGASFVAGFTFNCMGPIIPGPMPGPIPGPIPMGPCAIIPAATPVG